MIDCPKCGRRHRKYHAIAKCRWGRKAVWITGEGPFALLAHCRQLSITLWPTLEEARKKKAVIDSGGCGGMCLRIHEIVRVVSV
jgi:hypothetical protein